MKRELELATHFIYAAAGQPPQPGVMTVEQWQAYKKKDKPEAGPGTGLCYLCGEPMVGEGLPVVHRLGETWTAHDTAAARDSEWLCPACVFSLSEAAEHPAQPKPFKMRTFSHYVDENEWLVFGLSDKRDIAKLLMLPSYPAPWMLCITEAPLSASHQLYRTPVNHGGSSGWAVNLGGKMVRGNAAALASLLSDIEAMYNAGHNKTAIKSGVFTPKLIVAQSEATWATLETRLSLQRGTPLFDLALFLAQKEQGDK